MTTTYFATGVILISASWYMFFKIYKGSKSKFAFTLMTFTMIDGIVNFAFFFISIYRHPIIVDNQTLPYENFYAF